MPNMTLLRTIYIAAIALLITLFDASAQSRVPGYIRDSIAKSFQRIAREEVKGCYPKIEDIRLGEEGDEKVVEIRASVDLAYYPMRREGLDLFYGEARRLLGSDFKRHTILIYADGELIDELVPYYYSARDDKRFFTNRTSRPLVTRKSALSQPTRGLQSRHIALWQSHGRYFDNKSGEWRWQRSRLWETVEDLYTQGYVIPFLLPMLERAGATVLLPRERSMQKEEVIIDNDAGIDTHTSYDEVSRSEEWSSAGGGFAHLRENYPTGHNPFHDGTSRKVATTTNDRKLSTATWSGEIPASGVYSVYVSYRTLSNSVSDARYTVHASGADHTLLVNQRMGDRMWVCLGDYYFEKGKHTSLVTLDNYSKSAGVVTADAVKIGGGMGNIAREVDASLRSEDGIYHSTVSGYPRFTEGARYWLQWSGFPTSVYQPKGGKDDYRDDYMSRAHWVNALMGGSERLEEENGKNIPLDLAFAFHSDAGVRLNDDVIGTLGIYCTKDNEGEFTDSISRLRSRDLTDLVMSEIVLAARKYYEPAWVRRGMWDRSYYEARVPSCPTMLLELLSHQNFADMRYGLDPSFRFTVSRAIYVGMLRYLSSQYGTPFTVQPLPVKNFSAELVDDSAHLAWEPTTDELNPSAEPDYYILYTRVGDGGFDGGRRVDATTADVAIEAGKIYSFRITAVNSGGESFDSETLAVCRAKGSKGSVMVINGFTRVAAPLSVQGDVSAGFFNQYDSGAAYLSDISFIGEQKNFDRSLSRSENDNYALGASYNDYETEIIAGNSFDFVALHGASILSAGYSFSSSSRGAVEAGRVVLKGYDAVDVIMGKQRATTVGRGAMECKYEAFTEALQREITAFTASGGSLLLSGSYMLHDMWHSAVATDDDRRFAEEVLHVAFGGDMATRDGDVRLVPSSLTERRLDLCFNTELRSDIYRVESPEVVLPKGKGASVAMRYTAGGQSAGVAYAGAYRTVVMGFPFETILDDAERDKLMSNTLKFLTKKR